MKQPLIKQLLKPVLFLFLLTLICAFLTRTLTKAETLTDHASKKHGTGTSSVSDTPQEEAYSDEATHIDETNNKEIKEDALVSQEKKMTEQDIATTMDTTTKATMESASKTTTESASKATADTASKATTDTATEATTDTATEATTDTATEATTDTATEATTDTATEATTDTATEATTDINTVTNLPDHLTVYQDGFAYCELTDEIKKRITGISYPLTDSAQEASASIAPATVPSASEVPTTSPSSSEIPATSPSASEAPALNVLAHGETPAVSYEDLRYLTVLYYDFNGEVQSGELICHKGIVQDLAEIFYELYRNEYQIEKIKLIDEYLGDDTASMLDNNTSCFNYRVVDGTSSLSKHALGCAIDINPFYNPYVVFHKDGTDETYISPAGSEAYADRSKNFPYKIDENDLCYRLFKEHGFVWGGNWNSCKDYQHFQKVVE